MSQQGREGEHPAFSLVVCPENKPQIFATDHQNQHPTHQRQHPIDVCRGDWQAVVAMKAFPNSIKRAGAYITVDHAQGRQDHPRRK